MERISPQALDEERRRGGVLILDVRSEKAYEGSDERIPGDERRSPDQMESWWNSVPKGMHVVTYCT